MKSKFFYTSKQTWHHVHKSLKPATYRYTIIERGSAIAEGLQDSPFKLTSLPLAAQLYKKLQSKQLAAGE